MSVSHLLPGAFIRLRNDKDDDVVEIEAGLLQVSGFGRLLVERSGQGITLRVPKAVFDGMVQEWVGSQDPS